MTLCAYSYFCFIVVNCSYIMLYLTYACSYSVNFTIMSHNNRLFSYKYFLSSNIIMKSTYNYIEEYEDDFSVYSKSDIDEQTKLKQRKAKQIADNLERCNNHTPTRKTLGDYITFKKPSKQYKANQVADNLERCNNISSTKSKKKIPSKNEMYWLLPQTLANEESIKDIMKTLSETAASKGLHGGGRVVHIKYLPQHEKQQNKRVSCIVTVSSEQAVNDCLKVKYCLNEYMHRLCHQQQQLESIYIDKCRTKEEIESIRKLKTKLKRLVEG